MNDVTLCKITLYAFSMFYTRSCYMKDVALCPYLYDRGVFISQFAYPKQSDTPITRIIVSALHTEKDILKLAKAVNDFYKNKLYNILCN